jgi:hypothetical protein
LQKQLRQEEAAIIERVAEKQRELEEREAQRELLMESRNAGAVKLDMIAKEMGIVVNDGDLPLSKEMFLASVAPEEVEDLVEDVKNDDENDSDSSADESDSSDEGDDENSSSDSSASSSDADENDVKILSPNDVKSS